jgi:hypothetical protein
VSAEQTVGATPDTASFAALAAHHHGRMDARRQIGLKAFLAYAAFEGYLVKVILDNSKAFHPRGDLLWVVTIATVTGLIALAGMLIQIEKSSTYDRSRYHYYQNLAYESSLPEQAPAQAPVRKAWWITVLDSWATTWPLFAALGIGIAAVVCAVLVD